MKLFSPMTLFTNYSLRPLFLFCAPISLYYKFIITPIKMYCYCLFMCLLLLLSQDIKALQDEY